MTAPKKIEVRAMGNKEIQTSEGGKTTTVYRVSRPAKMVTFTTAENIIEERLAIEGLPEVVVFSSARGMDENMLHDTGADLVSSINYFQQLFGSPLQVDRLDASMIAAGHGQAFEGLLHLADFTGVEYSDTVPMFRAHEVAHQWGAPGGVEDLSRSVAVGGLCRVLGDALHAGIAQERQEALPGSTRGEL